MLIGLMREYLRPYRSWLTWVVLLQLGSVLGVLLIPTLNADIINKGIIEGDTPYIMRTGGVMLAVALLQLAATIGSGYYGVRTALALGRDLRNDIFDRVQRFSARELGTFGTPSLITRTTNDVQQVQTVALLAFTLVVSAPLICLVGVALALRQSGQLSAVLLVSLPGMAIIFVVIIRRMRPLFGRMQGRVDQANRILREQITGVRVIRAFVRDRSERERFAVVNDDLRELGTGTGWLIAMMYPLVMLLINVSSLGVLWFGGYLVDGGSLSVGSLAAFTNYLQVILGTTMLATFMFMSVPRAEICAVRIREVLRTRTSIVVADEPVSVLPEPGLLELRGLTFGYPGAEIPVLSGIDLVARPGEVLALVGSTGSGKTTLLELIPRLSDASAGQVLVGGVDVRELDPGVLSAHVGLVPQRAYLFAGTIGSNLRYANPDATEAELWQALEISQAREFVEQLPGRLDAEVSQGAGNLSGGQRQRIAIARTLVRRPRIYLFDDSFSALDYATDSALRAALAPQTADATVVVVAQRVSAIRDADRIAVLDQGRIVGLGPHTELMESCRTYQEIVLSQLSEQEAA